MPALKVHVRPPHKHKGLVILCVFYGIMFGGIVVLSGRVGPWLAPLLSGMRGTWGIGLIVPIIMFVGLAVPPLIVACSLGRSCQHKWPTFWCGQIAGTCMPFVGVISQFFLFPGSRPHLAWWEHLKIVGACLGFGAAMGLGFLLVRFFYVSFISVLVEQDGTLCVECGYCVAQSPSERCSECGTPVDTPLTQLGLVQRFAECLGSHSRKMVYLVSLLVAVGAAFFVWYQLPVWRFFSTIEGEEVEYSYSEYSNDDGQSRGVYVSGSEIGREVQVGASVGHLVAQLHRPAFFEAPLMSLRLATKVPFPGPVGAAGQPLYFFLDSVPRVVCKLNEAQTRYVLKHDIPQPLIDALVEAAEEAGWVPMTLGAPWPSQPDVVVSADGYFPELEQGEE